MGSGISSNYENITMMFTLGYWKVHSAARKDTHDPVSLWLLDFDKIKSESTTKKERTAYIESCLYSMKTLQQLFHPNVLKIYEANENLNDLAFSAEPILFSMDRDINYSNDEAYYIADQLASLASYLTNDKKFVSFQYYPGSFAFNSKFILKLCLFNYTSLIIGNENKTVPRYPWHNIPYAPPLNYTAPEYSNNLLTTSAADTFSYGALITSLFIGKQFFNFQNEKEIQRAIATGSFEIPETIPSDMRGLLQCCFESDPSRRLTFNEITRFPVFMNLLVRILREVDSIMKRTQSERYEFYIRLKKNISLFSLRILRDKILPLCIEDVKFDVRFGQVVFPIIYFIAEKLKNDEFMRLIFVPLAEFMRKMNPPENGIAVLEGLHIAINHMERNHIFDNVYPILASAFNSQNSMVQIAAAKNMPYLATMVTENCITYNIIPRIGEIILRASDPKVIGYLLKTYEVSIDKMDNDMFLEGVIPTLFKLWKKIRAPQLAIPYLSIIRKQNSTLIKSISFIVPLICEILKVEEIDLQVQSELCNYVMSKFEEIKKERGMPTELKDSNIQSNEASKIPRFAKQIQQYASESMPNYPIHKEPQTNLAFFEQNLSNSTPNIQPISPYLVKESSSNENEFTQLDNMFMPTSNNNDNNDPKNDNQNNTNEDQANFSNSNISNNINSNISNNESASSFNFFSDINNSNSNNLNSSNSNFNNFNSSSNNSNPYIYNENSNNNSNSSMPSFQPPNPSQAATNNVDQNVIQQNVSEFSFF